MPDDLHVAYDVDGVGQWTADSIPESFTIPTDIEVDENPTYGDHSSAEIKRLTSIIRRLTYGYNNTLRVAIEKTEEHDGCNEGRFDFISSIYFSWRPTPFDVEVSTSFTGVTVNNPFEYDEDDITSDITNELPSYYNGNYVTWNVQKG